VLGNPVNYWAILVSGVAAVVIGAVWYSPGVFGKAWMQLVGFKKEDMKKAKQEGMAGKYLTGFIGALVMAFILAHFIGFAGASSAVGGAIAAFWLWLGFIATTTLGSVLWERKPLTLYFLNNAYNLLSLLVMGVILGAWV
tara:strand:- start:182 stop:601 length:420 start_codon:yes stop_codon:yes gene_type:complete